MCQSRWRLDFAARLSRCLAVLASLLLLLDPRDRSDHQSVHEISGVRVHLSGAGLGNEITFGAGGAESSARDAS